MAAFTVAFALAGLLSVHLELRRNAFTVRNVEVRFQSSTARHSSSEISCTGVNESNPSAAATRMSTCSRFFRRLEWKVCRFSIAAI